MQEVNWDAVNLLELGMLLDMAKDGYEFQIADGRIKSIEVKLLSLMQKEGLCTIRMILM